jgi:hypothetical protein
MDQKLRDKAGGRRKGWTEKETREEIQHLLDQYREYMRIQGVKYSMSSLSAFAKLSAGLIEDTIKLRLQNIAETVVSMFTANVNLMEAELKAPGREVAYIDQLNRRFESY